MNLETLGMLNWSHSIPNEEEKNIFEGVLTLLPENANILEIGSYTGTSLIAMLQKCPTAKITAIDIWNLTENELNLVNHFANKSFDMSNVKEAFYKNLKTAGVENKVEVIEKSSLIALRDMVEKKRKYDFIYVDGSHECLDVLSDIILSWQLLRKGGILGLDDVVWSPNPKTVLNCPEQAVRWFLSAYRSDYTLLYSGYRVFVQKR